ncbi:MAG: site-specific integrase [Bacteroidales bacterium]|nr:site-specific integrase [Bacteroidales bacterium]
MQATVKIFYQTAPAKKNKDGLFPVKLRVTHKTERKYYSIRQKLNNDEWAYLSEQDIAGYKEYCEKRGRSKYREIYEEYERITDEAKDIIKSLPRFSFNQFEDKFNIAVTKWDNVFDAFIDHIKDLRDENRHGYASSFESTLRAVKEFNEGRKYKFNDRKDKVSSRKDLYLSGKELKFIDITPSWLKRFDKHMSKDGKSRTTIGIYMRNLRVLFNYVIKEKNVKAEYPFSKYQIKNRKLKKRALAAADISKIASYETEHPQEIFYRDMFMFSFLSNGMNTADIARLKYSDIKGDEISFVRQKTKEKETEETLNVPITQSIQNIINRHGNRHIGHDAYLFPILNPNMTERDIYYANKQFTKMVNKYVGNISESLGIGRITSYAARHSWATISKNSGTSTEYIKEALGHSSVIVTENYLKSFEQSTRRKHSEDMEKTVYKSA